MPSTIRNTVDKPTIVGACILDLAKKFMFEFYYKVMKTNIDCNLLYSDTDSFLFEVRTIISYLKCRNTDKKNSLLSNLIFQTSLPSTRYTAGTMHVSLLNSKTRWETSRLLSFVDSNQSCLQSSSLKASTSLFNYPLFTIEIKTAGICEKF